MWPVAVAEAYNPSYLGASNQEDHGSRRGQAKNSQDAPSHPHPPASHLNQ
jgi:hypothetical protein